MAAEKRAEEVWTRRRLEEREEGSFGCLLLLFSLLSSRSLLSLRGTLGSSSSSRLTLPLLRLRFLLCLALPPRRRKCSLLLLRLLLSTLRPQRQRRRRHAPQLRPRRGPR